MGALVEDKYVQTIQAQANFRFSPGDGLKEMAALQKEFEVFSDKHPLSSSAALLNIAPMDDTERRGWFKYLDGLKKVPSDQDGVSGHDRIVSELRTNLESKSPRPVYFEWHSAETEPGVTVRAEAVYSFSKASYIVISLPTLPPLAKRKPKAKS